MVALWLKLRGLPQILVGLVALITFTLITKGEYSEFCYKGVAQKTKPTYPKQPRNKQTESGGARAALTITPPPHETSSTPPWTAKAQDVAPAPEAASPTAQMASTVSFVIRVNESCYKGEVFWATPGIHPYNKTHCTGHLGHRASGLRPPRRLRDAAPLTSDLPRPCPGHGST